MLKEPVKLGSWYRCRDGVVVGPMEEHLSGAFPFVFDHSGCRRSVKSNGRYRMDEVDDAFDLIEEVNPDGSPIQTEAERLEQQTIEAFAAWRKDRSVRVDASSDAVSWHEMPHPMWNAFYYRLRPIDPPKPEPRFSVVAVNEDVVVRDRERPDVEAWFGPQPEDSRMIKDVLKRLNSGSDTVDDYEWRPINPTEPVMGSLEMADVPPGSVFRLDEDSDIRPHGRITTVGVEILINGRFAMRSYDALRTGKYSILRPGHATWSKCEKPVQP